MALDPNSAIGLLVRQRFERLSAKQKQVAEFLLEHPEEASRLSARQLARCTGASAATVVRLARVLGFAGFGAMQASLFAARQHTSIRSEDPPLLPSHATDNAPRSRPTAPWWESGIAATRQGLRFQILGPLEVHAQGGPVALGGIKPRAVLAYLLLRAGEPVRIERLVMALWGDDAPGGAMKTIQIHISRLRKALWAPGLIKTTAAGYVLELGPDDVLDAQHFGGLVEIGRDALVNGEHERARALLREALGLWRGPALADLAFELVFQNEIARLEEQRFLALEYRIEADLRGGHHAAVVGELFQLVAANPTREQLTGQLMIALYRCGRQAEALDAFARLRAYQSRELGLEPGPALRQLQAQVLAQSPELAVASA